MLKRHKLDKIKLSQQNFSVDSTNTKVTALSALHSIKDQERDLHMVAFTALYEPLSVQHGVPPHQLMALLGNTALKLCGYGRTACFARYTAVTLHLVNILFLM